MKTSLSGTFHVLRFAEYTNPYLGALYDRFNQRCNLAKMTERLMHVIGGCSARPERLLRNTELAIQPGDSLTE